MFLGCSLSISPDESRLGPDGGLVDTGSDTSRLDTGRDSGVDTARDTGGDDTGGEDTAPGEDTDPREDVGPMCRPSDCDDGIDCTEESCDRSGRCRSRPRDELCPAGQECNRRTGCEPLPCPDEDRDDVCDVDDLCPGGDDRVDRDRDGRPDACDRCPEDAPPEDTDGDEVCNADDVCPTGDDRVDTDSDGTPDACDRCPADPSPDCVTPDPCETLPEIPLPTMVSEFGVTTVQLDGGRNVIRARPGQMVGVRIAFSPRDCACPRCINQFQVGFESEDQFEYCAYSSIAGCSPASRLVISDNRIEAPTTPGLHYIAGRIGQDFFCPISRGWWDSAPTRIAAICVSE